MSRRSIVTAFVVAALVASTKTHEPSAHGALDPLADAAEAITALDVDRAKALLDPLDAADPRVGYQRARLAMDIGDCDEAERRLSPNDVQKIEGAPALLDVARGCARAMAAVVEVRDDKHQVVVRLQDDADRAHVPIVGETIARQRVVLERDLGVTMPLPSRVDVVRDQTSLAAMTGLPLTAAQTTGTVAIAKFGRVILVSPRASTSGYVWRDTLAHELTHLALARGTLDHAPLWLQEGVAKRQETRWREAGPRDDDPPADAVAAVGLAKKLGRPLDALGPSLAMLPSARESLVCYAEVASFVRFIAGDRVGEPGASTDAQSLQKLVKAYARGLDTDASLRAATGRDLKQWNAIWQPWVATKATKLPASLGLDATEAPFDHATAERARIGALLLGRGHVREARTRLDEAVDAMAKAGEVDPFLLAHAALARLRGGDAAAAKALVDPETKATAPVGLWWAVRGAVLRALGVEPTVAQHAFSWAIALDPLRDIAACGWADGKPGDEAMQFSAQALCLAAKSRATPDVGRD
jgi:hypothetical protein